jgi:hypothetical protein
MDPAALGLGGWTRGHRSILGKEGATPPPTRSLRGGRGFETLQAKNHDMSQMQSCLGVHVGPAPGLHGDVKAEMLSPSYKMG